MDLVGQVSDRYGSGLKALMSRLVQRYQQQAARGVFAILSMREDKISTTALPVVAPYAFPHGSQWPAAATNSGPTWPGSLAARIFRCRPYSVGSPSIGSSDFHLIDDPGTGKLDNNRGFNIGLRLDSGISSNTRTY
jgi:hypothetical protein